MSKKGDLHLDREQGSSPHADSKSLETELLDELRLEGGQIKGNFVDACDDENESDEDPRSGRAFGPPFLEKLLLGIILAHPKEGTDYRSRLRTALRALTGARQPHPGPLPGDEDDRWLLWMAEARAYSRARGGKPRSDSELAAAAIQRFAPNLKDDVAEARIDQLRKKFGGTYWRKAKHGDRSTNYKITYIYRSIQHDYVLESVEAQGLRKIADLLSYHGTSVDLEWIALSATTADDEGAPS